MSRQWQENFAVNEIIPLSYTAPFGEVANVLEKRKTILKTFPYISTKIEITSQSISKYPFTIVPLHIGPRNESFLEK